MVDDSGSSQLVRRLDQYCNPGRLGPLLPAGPYLCGFPDQNTYNLASRAVLEAFHLARTALRVLAKCDEDPALTRYFDIGSG